MSRSAAALLIQFLAALLMLAVIFARGGGLNPLLFWPTLWIFLGTSLVIIVWHPPTYKLWALILLSVSISSVPLIALEDRFPIGRDGAFEAQLGHVFATEGRWDPTLGSGFAENYYGYYPVLHLVLASAELASGIDSFLIIKFVFFVLFRLTIALLAYMIITELLGSERKFGAGLGALIFLGSSGMAFLSVSRRATAAIFVLFAIYCILRSREGERKWNVLFMIFAILLVLSDRSVATFFLIFLFGSYVFSKLLLLFRWIPRNAPFYKIGDKLVFFLAIFIGWRLIFSRSLLHEDLVYFGQVVEIINRFLIGTSLIDIDRPSATFSIYRGYEFATIMFGQFVFGLLAFVGLVLLLAKLRRRPGSDHDFFLLYFSTFGMAMYVIAFIMMQSRLDIAVTIMLWFFSLPLSILAATAIVAMMRWLRSPWSGYFVAVALIALLFSGALLMGIFSPRIVNRAPDEDIVYGDDARTRSEALYSLGKWLSENAGADAKLLADADVFEVASGYFEFKVNGFRLWLLTLYTGSEAELQDMIDGENFQFGHYRSTTSYAPFDYFIINRDFFDHQNYLTGDPIDPSRLDLLDRQTQLRKVYDSREYIVYKIERGIKDA